MVNSIHESVTSELPPALTDYRAFLERKIRPPESAGFPCGPEEVHLSCKPHQRDIVAWAVRGGRRAVFASFGLVR